MSTEKSTIGSTDTVDDGQVSAIVDLVALGGVEVTMEEARAVADATAVFLRSNVNKAVPVGEVASVEEIIRKRTEAIYRDAEEPPNRRPPLTEIINFHLSRAVYEATALSQSHGEDTWSLLVTPEKEGWPDIEAHSGPVPSRFRVLGNDREAWVDILPSEGGEERDGKEEGG